MERANWMPDRNYKVKYTLAPEAGEFTAEACREAGGGCDALVLVSMLFPSDGSYSQRVVSFDGRSGGDPISDADLFKVWAVIAAQLTDSESLREGSSGQHGLAEYVHRMVRMAVLEGK